MINLNVIKIFKLYNMIIGISLEKNRKEIKIM